MIAYNPREWVSLIVRFHKADTVRLTFPALLVSGVYTLLIVIVDIHFLKLGPESHVAKMSVMYSILGFVISLLLVFRTNTAYERWWEGRKLWGSLTNSIRNTGIKVNAVVANPADKKYLLELAAAFPFALKNHLRNENPENEKDVPQLFITEPHLHGKKHLPLQISRYFYERLLQLSAAGHVSGEQVLIINSEAQQWMEICGGCERIRNTPIPYSYSSFLKKFIFIYVLTLPITYAPVLGYFAIPIVIFIFYVLTSLELIAEEIENPFGNDANDLPLDEISKNIRNSIELIQH